MTKQTKEFYTICSAVQFICSLQINPRRYFKPRFYLIRNGRYNARVEWWHNDNAV